MEKGEAQELKLILKGDVSGSVEALEDALLKIEVGDDVSLRIIDRGVGAITENDVNLATRRRRDHHRLQRPARRARSPRSPTARASRSATTRSSTRRSTRSRRRSRACSSRSTRRSQLGTAEIREVFRSSKFGNIAGCAGTQSASSAATPRPGCCATARSSRTTSAIETLRRFKDDATEVREGFECGIGLGSYNDIKVDDVIETFEMREKPRA